MMKEPVILNEVVVLALSVSWWLSLLLVLAFWGLGVWSLLHGLIPLLGRMPTS